MNLPISINPLDYGFLLRENKFDEYIEYFLSAKGYIFIIKKFKSHNEIELFKNEKSLVKFTDTNLFENKFIRTIGNKTYFFENKKQILFTKELKTKFISRLQKSKSITNNIITLDIETYIHENILIPYLICLYDGNKVQTFAL
jgi:hypothetical protein